MQKNLIIETDFKKINITKPFRPLDMVFQAKSSHCIIKYFFLEFLDFPCQHKKSCDAYTITINTYSIKEELVHEGEVNNNMV